MSTHDPECCHSVVGVEPDGRSDLTLSASPVLGDHIVEIRAHGDVDNSSTASLGRALAHATALLRRPAATPTSWCPEVVCDLSGIEFFGAAGVRTLLHAASEARESGVVLSVVASRRVHRVLALTGTDGAVPLHTPTAAATGPHDEGDRR